MGHAMRTNPRPVYGVKSSDPSTTLEELAAQFRDAAMALDPTISKCWLGYDELMDGPREMRVLSVYLEREHAPMMVKRRAA
jgi:hypothetical protein